MAVGKALLKIRDNVLYREGWKTFEDYCRMKWGIGKSHANGLIRGSQVAANLIHGAPGRQLCAPCEIQPTCEYQIRPLTILEPEQQRTVWEEAVKTAPAGKGHIYKIWPGDMAFRERLLALHGTPLLPPCPTPDRRFMGSGEAVSPVPSAFMFLGWVPLPKN